jgi:hypothetical protein
MWRELGDQSGDQNVNKPDMWENMGWTQTLDIAESFSTIKT